MQALIFCHINRIEMGTSSTVLHTDSWRKILWTLELSSGLFSKPTAIPTKRLHMIRVLHSGTSTKNHTNIARTNVFSLAIWIATSWLKNHEIKMYFNPSLFLIKNWCFSNDVLSFSLKVGQDKKFRKPHDVLEME